MGRKVRTIVALALGMALIFVLTGDGMLPQVAPAPVKAANSVQVSLNVVNEVVSGTNLTVTVDIGQLENFDTANYDVSFEPTVLRLDNVTSGDIGGTTISVDVWNERSPGTFTIVQNVPGLPGVTGSGYLAVLHFSVIGSPGGGSSINLSKGTLGNTLAQEIPATWTGGSVRVLSAPAGGQGEPPSPPITPAEPEAATSETGAVTAQAESETIEPEAATTQAEAETQREELPPTTPPAGEPVTTQASDVAPAPPPPPPAAQTQPINWIVVGGVMGGVAIVSGLIIFLQFRRRLY